MTQTQVLDTASVTATPSDDVTPSPIPSTPTGYTLAANEPDNSNSGPLKVLIQPIPVKAQDGLVSPTTLSENLPFYRTGMTGTVLGSLYGTGAKSIGLAVDAGEGALSLAEGTAKLVSASYANLYGATDLPGSSAAQDYANHAFASEAAKVTAIGQVLSNPDVIRQKIETSALNWLADDLRLSQSGDTLALWDHRAELGVAMVSSIVGVSDGASELGALAEIGGTVAQNSLVLSSQGVRVANLVDFSYSAAEAARLKKFYYLSQEYGAKGVKQLENGRFRFYGPLTPANTMGEMAGRRFVREWDPVTGVTRGWHETLDHGNRVRIVRPEPKLPQGHFIFDAEGNYVGTRP